MSSARDLQEIPYCDLLRRIPLAVNYSSLLTRYGIETAEKGLSSERWIRALEIGACFIAGMTRMEHLCCATVRVGAYASVIGGLSEGRQSTHLVEL